MAKQLWSRWTITRGLLVGIISISCLAGQVEALAGLYGVTADGRLVSVDSSTALTSTIRSELPSGDYHSLVIVGDYFYTFDANQGNLYKFGLVNGDERIVGRTSLKVLGMSVRPSDGRVFAAVSNNGDLLGDVVAEVDLTDGTVGNFLTLHAVNQAYINGLRALAYFSDSQVLATSYVSPGWSYIYRLDQATGAIYDLDEGGSPYNLTTETCMALTINPATQRIYCVSDHQEFPLQWRLYEIVDGYPDPDQSSKVYIGDLDGQGGTHFHITALAYPSSLGSPVSTSNYYRVPIPLTTPVAATVVF